MGRFGFGFGFGSGLGVCPWLLGLERDCEEERRTKTGTWGLEVLLQPSLSPRSILANECSVFLKATNSILSSIMTVFLFVIINGSI
jgi:hypothetical protein